MAYKTSRNRRISDSLPHNLQSRSLLVKLRVRRSRLKELESRRRSLIVKLRIPGFRLKKLRDSDDGVDLLTWHGLQADLFPGENPTAEQLEVEDGIKHLQTAHERFQALTYLGWKWDVYKLQWTKFTPHEDNHKAYTMTINDRGFWSRYRAKYEEQLAADEARLENPYDTGDSNDEDEKEDSGAFASPSSISRDADGILVFKLGKGMCDRLKSPKAPPTKVASYSDGIVVFKLSEKANDILDSLPTLPPNGDDEAKISRQPISTSSKSSGLRRSSYKTTMASATQHLTPSKKRRKAASVPKGYLEEEKEWLRKLLTRHNSYTLTWPQIVAQFNNTWKGWQPSTDSRPRPERTKAGLRSLARFSMTDVHTRWSKRRGEWDYGECARRRAASKQEQVSACLEAEGGDL